MKLSTAAVALVVASSNAALVRGFTSPSSSSSANIVARRTGRAGAAGPALSVAAEIDESSTSVASSSDSSLDFNGVNSLSFRELQRECKERELPAVGNTAALRGRLLEFHGLGRKSPASAAAAPAEVSAPVDADQLECDPSIEFCDEGDKDFDYNSLRTEVMDKASIGHWKAATRKLKQLTNRFESDERKVDAKVYFAVLGACVDDRLHGARASEPARKIMEEMSERGYDISAEVGNTCVLNSLGMGPNGTHDGCGGIDVALAMLAAMESAPNGAESIAMDTYGAVVTALGRDGSIEESILLLRAMVVEHAFTPALSTFADVAQAAAKDGNLGEAVLQVLTLAKAAGYELDSIASAQVGRELLASGVIAAEQMGNIALGLRLLTAAGKAEGCAPDRGDDLVASSSAAAQRACTLIHKTAVDKAVHDDNWKLAVKLLQLMPERSLTPSNSVWRKVVTCCAKCNKSRRSTALLLDWVKLSEQGKAEKPPMSVFNTVVNACETCGEEELTVSVLEIMKKTLEIDGNIITSNIAMKRLAKQGNTAGCEGIIIGMLQSGIEPNVVSYTTAIGACATEPKDSALAYEWLNRMRSRNVRPNFHTYNTALAACLDGKLESTVLASTIANEMLEDVDRELAMGLKGSADFNSDLPDSYTKVLARALMKQLRENWRSGDINMAVAKATIRVPLLKLVDFQKSEAAEQAKKRFAEEAAARAAAAEEDEEITEKSEMDMEYNAVNLLHKDSHRIAEV